MKCNWFERRINPKECEDCPCFSYATENDLIYCLHERNE